MQRRLLEDHITEVSFEFRKQRFCWDSEERRFEKLKFPTQASQVLACCCWT